MSIVANKNAFVFRLDHRLTVSLRQDVIGLGWYQAEGLDQIKDWIAFKNIVRTAYPDDYNTNERSLGNAAGSIWRFLKDMKVGDYVVVPTENGFHVAEIKGEPFFDVNGANEKDDFAWRRAVRWITPKENPIPRNFSSNNLQMRMKARQTCVDASDLLLEIEEALGRKNPVTFTDTLLKTVYEPVSKALRSAVNNYGLEEIVRRLAAASGARAERQATNSGRPGDVDVISYHDLKIGNQAAIVKVCFQVKQHDGVSDEFGISQIIERMRHDPSLDRGYFVTTAPSVSDIGKKLAEDNDITIITEKDLIEWIMMVGLRALG
jgi:predicted Mrr-cat superfamily restriction endonuclease